jgi:hypothetical protein
MVEFSGRVGISTGYGWMVRIRFPAMQDFSLLHNFQTGHEDQPASCTMYTGDLFVRVKGQEREADHSPLSSAKINKGGAIPPPPHMSSWRAV